PKLRGIDMSAVPPSGIDLPADGDSSAFLALKKETRDEMGRGNYTKVRQLVVQLVNIAPTRKDKAYAIMLWANLENNVGQYRIAIHLYDMAMMLIRPDEDEALWFKIRVNGLIAQAALGLHWNVIPCASEIELKAPTPHIRGYAALARGMALLKAGRPAEAEQAFDRSARYFSEDDNLIPDEVSARLWEARAHSQTNSP